ncbi:tyrosyl-DNA phosphodiesterase-domain-containing protein [Mycena maculata]|uniref:Tyrosyl-DNA phosphodiesterase-domain-containing protein n=1 Tax=Mycena maculata TaxID=230809 RepID=A0AAD7IJR8_9AGAR|nr:tyrosyl-DNA phosphodiesterase-domain-containing protein [Mycena maculata]
MYSDNDADLARAIAESLRDAEGASSSRVAKKTPAKKEVLVISSDEEDIVEMPRPSRPEAGAGPLSFLNDRAEMERGRVARQKRLRGPSPPPPASSGDDDDDNDGDGTGSGSEGSARKRVRLDSTTTTTTATRSFPLGAVLRVDTQHAQRAETVAIRLSDVLGPRDELAFVILSAFVVDPAWIYSFFDPETPVVLVTDPNTSGADANASRPTLKNMFPNWVRVCPPLTNGRGCMHMKYMLLFSKTGALRVVVASANLVPHDWRDVENYLFIQDFPRATPGAETVRLRANEKPSEVFPAVLAGVLRATGVEEALAIMERQGHTSLPISALATSSRTPKTSLETSWDWTLARAALVPSVAGQWEGWAGMRAVVGTGQPRLMRAVQVLGCGLEDGKGKGKDCDLELDCLTSSIGTYSPPWLAVFRLCAAGRSRALQAWLDRGRKKTPAQRAPLRVLFPTLETVRGTTAGEAGAGTVFCRRAQWGKISALLGGDSKLEMRDSRSRSGPVGTHTKMILGTLRVPEADPDDTEDTEDESDVEVVEPKKPHAWLYVGSHNFTASAWGTLSGNGFNPVLNVTNYELGVVLRLETPADADAAVAWERPARRYARGDLPWIQDESPFFQ